jgi:hypothetical protein
MSFDAQGIFANLAEKERIKGHHSPEGRAIRTLSRALNGWSSGSLSRRDVAVLCDQAMQDWLHIRLKHSPWSFQAMPVLLSEARSEGWITPADENRLQDVHELRARADGQVELTTPDVEAALEFCIQLVEKHW